MPCPWSSTTARSAAMLAENARPFTSAPKGWLIGSSPLPPPPVDSPPMQVAMGPAKVPGEYEPTPALPHFPRPLNRHGQRPLSIFLLLSDPLQLWPATLNSETPPKSTGCRPAAWHLTESLVFLDFPLLIYKSCSILPCSMEPIR